MKKPLIGINPLMDIGRDSYWMLPGYMKGIEQAGGIPIMLPMTAEEDILEQLVDNLDGILFTGGQDISPNIYHKRVSEKCGEICGQRDEMEQALLRLALEKDKPILGICRGIQFINATFGGTLYQDLPTEYESDVLHCQKPPYDCPIHKVHIIEDTPLYALLEKEMLPVNSYHHQAVKVLASALHPMAYSEDGLIEAVYCPDVRFLWAVQWHPEFSFESDESSRKIFKRFVEACGE